MSAAKELIKAGKAALTTSFDGHAHLVTLEDYEGRPLKSGYTGHDAGHSHPWIMADDGSIRIGEQHGHTHMVEALSKLRKHDAGDELGDVLKAACIITGPHSGHGHIVSLTDGEGTLIDGGVTARSGRPGHVHPWIVSKSGRIVIGEAEGHAHAIDDAEATAVLKRIGHQGAAGE